MAETTVTITEMFMTIFSCHNNTSHETRETHLGDHMLVKLSNTVYSFMIINRSNAQTDFNLSAIRTCVELAGVTMDVDSIPLDHIPEEYCQLPS